MFARITVFLMIVCLSLSLAGCGLSADRENGAGDPEQARPKPDREQIRLIRDMNTTADLLYRLTEEEQPERAVAEIQALSRQVSQFKFAGVTGVEGAQALMQVVVEGKKQFHAVRYDQRKALIAAARIRLAVDALDRGRRPMWMDYENVIMEDANEMREATDSGDSEQLKKGFRRTRIHYGMIRPAILINREPSQVEAVDSLLAAMAGRLRDGVSPGQFRPLVEHYATLMDEIFNPPSDETTAVPIADDGRPLWWIFVIGSFIVSVLTYVGWRKFRYEQVHGTPVRKEDRHFG